MLKWKFQNQKFNWFLIITNFTQDFNYAEINKSQHADNSYILSNLILCFFEDFFLSIFTLILSELFIFNARFFLDAFSHTLWEVYLVLAILIDHYIDCDQKKVWNNKHEREKKIIWNVIKKLEWEISKMRMRMISSTQ